jgi:putative flavoprotein involved in K+ transport
MFADGRRFDDVTSVIWATGYRPDHTWIDIPDVRDRTGAIFQHDGVTPAPGLYTLWLAWQHTRGSGLLGFVKNDAARLAERIIRFERHRDVATAGTDNALTASQFPQRPAA